VLSTNLEIVVKGVGVGGLGGHQVI
jgi:hypothetical protein